MSRPRRHHRLSAGELLSIFLSFFRRCRIVSVPYSPSSLLLLLLHGVIPKIIHLRSSKEPLTLLCNVWCVGDDVFFKNMLDVFYDFSTVFFENNWLIHIWLALKTRKIVCVCPSDVMFSCRRNFFFFRLFCSLWMTNSIGVALFYFLVIVVSEKKTKQRNKCCIFNWEFNS